MQNMTYDSIIFDLDGTLWDSTDTSARIWNEICKDYPEVTEVVTADKLKSLFGKPLRDIGIALFQSVSEERAVEIINDCCRRQGEFIAKEGGILYPQLEETLQELSKKYKLMIVSNCEDGYIESFFAAHGLQKYFTDYECPGRTGKLKADNIRIISERNGLKNPVYVGDTLGDATAAKEAGVPFIFAGYGFGEVKEYIARIESIHELCEIL